MNNQRQVVIIGAGFGGLSAARELVGEDVNVILVDRNNFHTFTPLIYQVATSALDPSSVAYPVRTIFRRNQNVNFMMGEVETIDYESRQIGIRTNGKVRQIVYDDLIIATGTVTNFFGSASTQQHAFGLKDLDDAVALREHILRLFEKAVWIEDEAQKVALTTFVVVGGGATGLESAGALFELYNFVLQKEFKDRPDLIARVVLVEGQSHLLANYPAELQASAKKQLESLGVEVKLGAMVEQVTENSIRLTNGETIPTHTVVWSAGVKASPVADMLDVPLQKGGRVPVTANMNVIGREGVHAVGDIVYLENENSEPYPQLIPVAMQQGKLAAKNILRAMQGDEPHTFRYRDRGIMATIGRSRAVAWIFYRIKLSGFLAWTAWLFLHLIMLMGFNNRIKVFLSWVWNYITYDRSVRIIIDPPRKQPVENTLLEEVA